MQNILLTAELINVLIISSLLPVLCNICGTFSINVISISLVSTKMEFFSTCKVSCLTCLLNMLVLLGVFDSFDSVVVWLDLISIQWYWMTSGVDISNIYGILIGNCWTTFVSIFVNCPVR